MRSSITTTRSCISPRTAWSRRWLKQSSRAVIGMQSLGGNGKPIQQRGITVRDAMTLPVSVTVSGIDSLRALHQNLEIARDFKPMAP